MIDDFADLLKNEPPFEWIRTDALSKEALELIEKRKLQSQNDTEKLVLIAEALLIKNHHNKNDSEKIMNGETKPPKSPNKKNNKKRNGQHSSSPVGQEQAGEDNDVQVVEASMKCVFCSICECSELAVSVCNCDHAIDPETNEPLKCKAAGVFFCQMHGPNHINHSNGLILKDVDETEILTEAIAQAKKKRDKVKKKKKERKEKMKKNIEKFNDTISKDLDAMTLRTSKKREEREKIVQKNKKNIKHMEVSLGIVNDDVDVDDDLLHADKTAVVIENADNIDDYIGNKNNSINNDKSKKKKNVADKYIDNSSNQSFPISDHISPSKDNIIITNEKQVVISNKITHTNNIGSPPAYKNFRSSTTLDLPEPVIPVTDIRCNKYAYHLLQTAFNGKGEPLVSFMETFNHSKFANWLPDIVRMYNIPIASLQSVFANMSLTTSESDTFLSEDSLVMVKSALKVKKVRELFLTTIYNYIINIKDE